MSGSTLSWWTFSRLGAVSLALVLVLSQGWAQVPCDVADDPLGYQPRPPGAPTHCEGFVEAEDVAGEEDSYLVTLFAAYAPYDTASFEPITIGLPPGLSQGLVRIQALGIPGKLEGYRMDASVVPPESGFEWSVEFLNTQQILPGDFGILGWIMAELERAEQAAYLPLRFYQGEGSGDERIVAGILTNTTLTRAELTVSPLGGGMDEREAAVPLEDEYPAGEIVHFVLPELSAGRYYLGEFRGWTRLDDPISHEFWVYVPPR